MSAAQTIVNYLQYWSLESSPFLQDDPNRFFSGSAQRSVLAQIEHFAVSDIKLAIIAAPPGCGTTRLLKYLSLHAGLGDRAVKMILAPEHPTTDDGLRTIWLVDRGNESSVRSLGSLPSDVSVVAAIDPQNPILKAIVRQRRATVIKLSPMTPDETRSYVRGSLRLVGGRPMIFTESAISRIHKECEGRIRDVSYLAEKALYKSWKQAQTTIRSSTIEQVSTSSRCAA